jgi:membrane protein
MKYLSLVWKIIVHLYNRTDTDRLTRSAASLSYSTLVSVVPFLIVTFYVLKPFPYFHGLGQEIQHFIINNFVSDLASNVNDQLSSFVMQMDSLRMTNIISLGCIVTLMMFNMVHAFNTVWHIEFRYNYFLGFIFYGLMVLIGPIMFAFLLLVLPSLSSIERHFGSTVHEYLSTTMMFLFPLLVSFVVFTVFNWALPTTKVKLRYAAIGGLFTTVFFELAKRLFSYYLSLFSSMSKVIYGAVAVIPFFLLWVYVAWCIILFGAMITNIMQVGLDRSIAIQRHLKNIPKW